MTNAGTRTVVAAAMLAALVVVLAWLAGPREQPAAHTLERPHRTLLTPVTTVTVAPDETARLMQRGRRVYEACVACHLPDGRGVVGTNPPLIGPHVTDAPAGRLIRAMIHGVEGTLTIDGEEYDGVMPPAQVETDADLAAVLTYIRRSWGNAGGPVTEAMVRAVRDATKDHAGHWSIEELLEIK